MAFVGNGDAHDYSGSTVTSVTMTYTSTVGNTLAIMVFGVPQGTPVEAGVTITDNAAGGSSTFVHPTGAYATDAASNYAWLFYCNSCKAATSFTIALNGGTQTGAQFVLAVLAEYSGWGNFSAFGIPNFQLNPTPSANVLVSGSASLASGAHVWGCSVDYSGGTNTTLTHGTSPITFASDFSNTALNPYGIESGTAPSAASYAATFGIPAGTDTYVTGMLAFAAAPAVLMGAMVM